MTVQSKTNQVLKGALALSATDPQAGVIQLEDELKLARARGDMASIHKLARNAAIICSSGLGEFRRALAYLEEALRSQPDDASLYALSSDLHRVLGDSDKAEASLSRSVVLAREQGDLEMASALNAKLASLKTS